jgi:5-methyltetrahydropteroyltriglutamate--homocysteine methyltransferase
MAAPYRADQVGSLLRPAQLLEARAAVSEGRMDRDELSRLEDSAILEAFELQRQIGMDIYTDGEYRRGSWAGDFSDSVEGYVPGPPPVVMQWRGTDRPPNAPATRGGLVIGRRLRKLRRLTARESSFLKERAPGPYKVTLPAASYMVARGYKPGITNQAYPSRADLLDDVVGIIRAEIAALVSEGVSYIQLDNPHYPDYVDDDKRSQWSASGVDPDTALLEDIAADNASLSGIERSGVILAMHLCRGNGRSAWHTSGGYDRIAEQVFGGIEVDRWLLEYDSDRAGGFEPLRFMPRNRQVVLGLITTKQGTLESKDQVLRRIDEAAKYMPAGQMALSPQCGFASVAEGNLLTPDDQRRKLQLVVQAARDYWK